MVAPHNVIIVVKSRRVATHLSAATDPAVDMVVQRLLSWR
jgi:hypothetical protein